MVIISTKVQIPENNSVTIVYKYKTIFVILTRLGWYNQTSISIEMYEEFKSELLKNRDGSPLAFENHFYGGDVTVFVDDIAERLLNKSSGFTESEWIQVQDEIDKQLAGLVDQRIQDKFLDYQVSDDKRYIELELVSNDSDDDELEYDEEDKDELYG